MTIVFLLGFNTLFLLVLVKVLRESNELQNNAFNINLPDDPRLGAVIDAFPNPASEVPLPTIEQTDIDNEAQHSSPDMEKEVEDEEIDDSPEVPRGELLEQGCTLVSLIILIAYFGY